MFYVNAAVHFNLAKISCSEHFLVRTINITEMHSLDPTTIHISAEMILGDNGGIRAPNPDARTSAREDSGLANNLRS